MSWQSLVDLFRGSFLRYVQLFNKQYLYEIYTFFFLFVFLLIAYASFDKIVSVDDHFFHIRFAQQVFEEGIGAFIDFSALPFTQIVSGGAHLIYYNFLFYLALIPFSFLTPMELGIQIFGITAATLSLTVVYSILRRLSVKQPFLWTLGFLVVLIESGAIIRFLSARPFTLAPVLLLIFLYALHRRRFLSAAMVAAFYFYWHTATFFLPLFLAGAYVAIGYFYRTENRIRWETIVLPLFGTLFAFAASYLIYPGVGAYLAHITIPLVFDAALPGGAGIVSGKEVYGADFGLLFGSLSVFVTIFLLLAAREWPSVLSRDGANQIEERRDYQLRMTLCFGAITLFLASFFSLRFADYFFFFAFPYLALSGSVVLERVLPQIRQSRYPLRTVTVLILTLFLINAPFSMQSHLEPVSSHKIAEAPALWLSEHGVPGSVIFNADWDAFPLFTFYTGDRFRFVTGLEPRFLYEYDERLYWAWRHIGDEGRLCELASCEIDQAMNSSQEADQIADFILTEFKSDTVLVRTDRDLLLSVLDASPRFQPVFRPSGESLFVIYRILPRPSSESVEKALPL